MIAAVAMRLPARPALCHRPEAAPTGGPDTASMTSAPPGGSNRPRRSLIMMVLVVELVGLATLSQHGGTRARSLTHSLTVGRCTSGRRDIRNEYESRQTATMESEMGHALDATPFRSERTSARRRQRKSLGSPQALPPKCNRRAFVRLSDAAAERCRPVTRAGLDAVSRLVAQLARARVTLALDVSHERPGGCAPVSRASFEPVTVDRLQAGCRCRRRQCSRAPVSSRPRAMAHSRTQNDSGEFGQLISVCVSGVFEFECPRLLADWPNP
jgi:hypothetical protein